MYTKLITYNQPVFDSDDSLQTIWKYADFETAYNAGVNDSTMDVVDHVMIVNELGKIVATWSTSSGSWIVFKDAKGKFVTPKKYFEQRRIVTERFCCDKGYNVRIRGNEFYLKLHAGTEVVKFRPNLLSLLEETCTKLWEDEQTASTKPFTVKKTEEEKLEALTKAFSATLSKLSDKV